MIPAAYTPAEVRNMQLPKPSDFITAAHLTRGAYAADLLLPVTDPGAAASGFPEQFLLPEQMFSMEISENEHDFGIILQKK